MEELVKKITKGYRRELFEKYFRHKSDLFTPYQEKIPINGHASLEMIGEIKQNSHDTLIVCAQPIEQELHARSGKKKQYEVGKRVLQQVQADAGIFIFYDRQDHFRISYIRTYYQGTRRTFSHFKRMTYFVSPDQTNRTFIQQMAQAKFDSLDTVEEAFSLKELTKEFYQEIVDWYNRAREIVRFPNDNNKPNGEREIALIRFITRMIFIWFMKEKDLIAKDLFDEKYIHNILKSLKPDETTYYKAILQNLFFATLNTRVEERRFRDEKRFQHGFNKDFGNTYVYRYENLFRDAEQMKELFSNIPFLNGGLFECLDEPNRDYYVDGFTDRIKYQPEFPNKLFFNDNEKEKGLINILSSYNFTIDENTPNDEEIALDPELLGRIFENLLASYNPETSENARKATGSYYTPREIVDDMVNRTLQAYFLHKLTASAQALSDSVKQNIEQKLEQLFSYEEENNPFDDATTEQLINLIHQLKIIDPAVGSGAFLMSLLHRLVFILSKLDPHNHKWKQQQLDALQQIPDPTLRDTLQKTVEERFRNNELDYGRKLYLIQNCMYGVDIQPIAIQIAKLRFFISLLVDEKIDRDADNCGIEPLPNLETHLVAANTLIGLKKQSSTQNTQIINYKIQEITEEIKKIRDKYFTATSHEEKKEIQERDQKLREQLKNLMKDDGWYKDDAEKIVAFDPYHLDQAVDWFDPYWMFGVNAFDIVMGNPPYIQLQKAIDPQRKHADLYKDEGYVTFDRTGDIYCLFYEKGIMLLKQGGILAFITSNKWMRAGYGEKLRKFFLSRNPLVLIDLGPGVFESATVDTSILIIQKAPNQKALKAVTIQKNTNKPKSRKEKFDLHNYVKNHSVTLTKLSQDAWFIGSDAEQRLKEKIERLGKPLKDWDVNIYRGVLTGLNEAFIISTQKRDEILANCKTKEERRRTEAIIKPILRGRDIKRYYYDWAGLWVIVIPAGWTNENRGKRSAEGFIQEQFPYLMAHLKAFEAKAKKRDDQGDYWWELRACAYYSEFEKEKIFFKAVGRNLTFAKVDPGIMLTAPASFLTGNNLNFILGVLCSKYTTYYVEQTSDKTGAGDIMLNVQSFERIKIPPITPTNKPIVQQIEALVDNILAAKKQNPNAHTSAWEREIDGLVYKLYDLTEEEVRLIEEHVNTK